MKGARIINRRPVVIQTNPDYMLVPLHHKGPSRRLVENEYGEQKIYDVTLSDSQAREMLNDSYSPAVAIKDLTHLGTAGKTVKIVKNPPEESLQEKSWREWQENFVRVSADPESASITDLMRAIGYLDHRRASIQRHAWEQGKKVDANVLAGYENEQQYYQRLIEQKQGRRRNSRNPARFVVVDPEFKWRTYPAATLAAAQKKALALSKKYHIGDVEIQEVMPGEAFNKHHSFVSA